MNIHYLQHVDFEGPGYIKEWAKNRNYRLTTTKVYAKQFFPEITNVDLLIVMGGPMSATDIHKFTWLEEEKSFISKAITEGKKVLGICLGAQLIASLLDAQIKKSPFTEIGWFPVSKTTHHSLFNEIPKKFTAFHWHGEMFEIPAGAKHIFESKGCSSQGFIFNDIVVGFQFHFETTQESLKSMLDSENIDGLKGKYIQTSNEILRKSDYANKNHKYLENILDKLVQL